MSPNRYLFAFSQFSSYPYNKQVAFNTITTKFGGFMYDFNMFNCVLSIFNTAS